MGDSAGGNLVFSLALKVRSTYMGLGSYLRACGLLLYKVDSYCAYIMDSIYVFKAGSQCTYCMVLTVQTVYRKKTVFTAQKVAA